MKAYLAIVILSLACASAQAGMAEVVTAEKAIEQAKQQRKEALKGLTKVERAELNLIKAQRALEKARSAPARCSTDSDCAAKFGGDGGPDTIDMPATTVRPAKKAVRT